MEIPKDPIIQDIPTRSNSSLTLLNLLRRKLGGNGTAPEIQGLACTREDTARHSPIE